jgi:hypothetical protein
MAWIAKQVIPLHFGSHSSLYSLREQFHKQSHQDWGKFLFHVLPLPSKQIYLKQIA